MEYSKSIANAIRTYLVKNDFNHIFDEQRGTFLLEAGLACMLKESVVVTQIQQDSYITYATVPVFAARERLAAVGEFLHRANYGLPNGKFELDYTDGEMHCSVFADCSAGMPTEDVIRNSYATPLALIDHFGDALLDVVNGFKTAEEAMKGLEK